MSHPVFKKKLLASCVAAACSASMSMVAQAQDGVDEEVVVFGIRGSLERAADIKREATGVVDAISAEDIGKFPDTNLAESLQRITGVSIDRVNGEGSNVTVRGFGGGNNLVTLNGRHLPTAEVSTIGGDQNADFAQGAGRSFDFSNLAAEGVSGLEVYKTGRASIPTGGIGATINIKTHRPLENPGSRGSIGVKLVNDTSVISGDDITPEVSGLVSWSNDDETFGVSLFASYQERNNSARSATVNGWNIPTYAGGFLAGNYVSGSTVIEKTQPTDPNQLVAIANDSRWHLSELERERTNAMITLQFKPLDNLTLTLDSLTVQNTQEEQRTDQTNWFNRPFNLVIFDDNPIVSTAVFMYEDIGGVKDVGFEQQLRSMEDTLDSVGFNADWQLSDSLNVNFDIHSASSESSPNGPNGASSILVGLGAPVISEHSVDFRSGFPVQRIVIDDSVADTKAGPNPEVAATGTNANGRLDVGDVGTSIGRTIASAQTTDVDQAKIDVSWELDFGTLDLGFDTSTVEMRQERIQTQQTLGNWGLDNPGDVEKLAPGMLQQYCLACLFEDFDPQASGQQLVAFKGNAGDLYNAISPVYASLPFDPVDPDPSTTDADDIDHSVQITNIEDNLVEEDIQAFYVQFGMEGELAGLPYDLVLGVRHEQTDVTSTSLIVPDEAIIWQSDNDFTVRTATDRSFLTQTGEYDNTLPSLDFSIDLNDEVKARASISKTISRPGYGNLFVADNAGTPPRPTALGGTATGTAGNPSLEPLESQNLDLSIEWYYGDASYISLGYYDKEIDNFVGTGVENRNLFGLRDPSSGEAGTRSGAALAELIALDSPGTPVNLSDVNLFTMTALIIQNGGDVTAASADFQAELGADGNVNQTFADSILSAVDIAPNSDDPLFDFAVQIPVNTETANIDGFEFAWQHFFGETGLGYVLNYTTVNGDVGIDVGSDPSVNQFALLGLSDSANFSLVYENHGLSARLSYNWRDNFLNATNRGSDRNPVFVDEYSQLDMNISYDVSDNLVLSFEGINLTEESTRHYGRDYSNLWFMQELDARYLLGARYTFE